MLRAIGDLLGLCGARADQDSSNAEKAARSEALRATRADYERWRQRELQLIELACQPIDLESLWNRVEEADPRDVLPKLTEAEVAHLWRCSELFLDIVRLRTAMRDDAEEEEEEGRFSNLSLYELSYFSFLDPRRLEQMGKVWCEDEKTGKMGWNKRMFTFPLSDLWTLSSTGEGTEPAVSGERETVNGCPKDTGGAP